MNIAAVARMLDFLISFLGMKFPSEHVAMHEIMLTQSLPNRAVYEQCGNSRVQVNELE